MDERPTSEGWYWWREDIDDPAWVVAEVYRYANHDPLRLTARHIGERHVSEVGGTWGPRIEEPDEN